MIGSRRLSLWWPLGWRVRPWMEPPEDTGSPVVIKASWCHFGQDGPSSVDKPGSSVLAGVPAASMETPHCAAQGQALPVCCINCSCGSGAWVSRCHANAGPATWEQCGHLAESAPALALILGECEARSSGGLGAPLPVFPRWTLPSCPRPILDPGRGGATLPGCL